MLTSFIEGLLCCLASKSANVVVPVESSEAADGYEFVEVKPGRVLRVRHILPDRPVVEEPTQGGIVSCKRKITVYRSGQLFIENLGERASAELKTCQNGDTEPNSTVEVELTDGRNSSPPVSIPEARSESVAAGNNTATPETGASGEAPAAGQHEPSQPPRKRRRKPKRTLVIDCERRIASCKGTHSDVALFFIHGVGGSLDIWGSQLDFFSRLGYEVIAPDLAGHGASSAPHIAAAYTFYALAEDMRLIFKRYAKKRNILIGHSYGVSFCTFLAHEFPDQIHKMVMINGGGPTALEPSLCSIFNLPTCVLHCLSPLLAWSFLKAGFARQGSKEKQLLRENNAFNVSSFVLRAMMSGQYWPEGDEVYHAELTVPVLLVHGMHDKFVPVEEDQRMAEILLMAFLKVLEDGSHMVMLECPEAVNSLLHEFFLWEPITLPPPKKEPKTRPETAKAQTENTRSSSESAKVRPSSAKQT
ncbi:abhydrolase domain-containing protein 8 [Austrofundulus limnaeus]|uniref:Protein ABHD8 n=1 Tax=Austrofundulus limnaeus TaxID=52670 RepID=A0A2I4B4V8_AUSLI|nr:PREDICTED: abhydrolase domain-containing protein 8 [Austrofundulus limnaeus]XP_013862779.1 PREDICTED: abhydrolase domain-containing protein 8 [Austrofundulus limnaeus]